MRLVVVYDVSGFSADEVTCLASEAHAQGEASDVDDGSVGHPDAVTVVSHMVDADDRSRVVLLDFARLTDVIADSLRIQLAAGKLGDLETVSPLDPKVVRDIAANLAQRAILAATEIEP